VLVFLVREGKKGTGVAGAIPRSPSPPRSYPHCALSSLSTPPEEPGPRDDGGELHYRLLRRVGFRDPRVLDLEHVIWLVIKLCWLMPIGVGVLVFAGDPDSARVPRARREGRDRRCGFHPTLAVTSALLPPLRTVVAVHSARRTRPTRRRRGAPPPPPPPGKLQRSPSARSRLCRLVGD